MTQRQHNRGWDTRVWLLGILGGAIGGSLTAWATYAPIHNWLNKSPFSLSHITAATIVSQFSLFFTLFVLPGLLSGLAQRWTFFWGLLPLSLFTVFFYIEDWTVNGLQSIMGTALIDLGIIVACLLISSGPVSLVRWLRVRAARQREALLASYQAQRGVASGLQEGIWPPPPEYRE